MNKLNSAEIIAEPVESHVAKLFSPQAKQLAALGQDRNWEFRVLFRAPMIDEPVRVPGWVLVPADEDFTPIPDHAMDRIQAIFATGLRPNFVLVHEAPQVLPAPAGSELATQPLVRLPALPEHVRASVTKISASLPEVSVAVAKFVGFAVAAAAAAAVVFAALVPLAVMAAAVSLDPILVAVTEDGWWIEIDRWDVDV